MSEQKVAICPYFKKCGGCQYQNLTYPQQLQKKQKEMGKLLSLFGKVEPIIGMEDPQHYRNKVHATFGRTRSGEIVSGTYQAGTHKIVNIDHCMIEDQKSQEIIRTIRGLLKSFKIKTYDEDSRYGLLRHVLVRRGFVSGEIMVVLVLVSPILPSKNNFVKALRKEHPEISTVVLNINDKKTSMVLGDRDITLYGKGYIEDTLCGKVFRISPQSFYQVNPVQTEVLYGKAIEFAELTGKERVIDAYCGIGTIGMIASEKAKEVIGVELNKNAVRDAKINAKRNNITNIQFYEADAGKFMVSMAEQGEKADVVLMDPPRSGSDEAFLSSVVQLAPKKVVYVSCGPDTLARDLKYLTAHGYKVKKIQPVDMFCYTEHVETVVLLSQRKADDYIEIDLDLDEMDITSAETKATYREVQQYVLQTTGLMVSNLNIAQIKDKCGFDKRENYNKPRTANARQPKCTLEKEKAIMDAFRHFGMI